MQLILLGAPGSGKGTQAKTLVSENGYIHISTGDLLRAEIAKASELGKKVESILASGALVDNDTVLELLKANCKLESGSYVFDGYPRNLEQAKCLEEVVLKGASKKVIYFKVNVDQLVTRLTQRRTCKGCGAIYNVESKPPKTQGKCDSCDGEVIQRKDDNEEVIRDRMGIFEKEIDPMLDYYRSQNDLETLDASLDIEEVRNALSSMIKS
jgi:adenylate kinase